MLERVWRKENPLTLLVGMQTSTATMENSVEISYDTAIPLLGIHTEETRIELWYIYTMEYYSGFKKNTFESVLMRWMKLEPIIQSEVSQKEKHQYSILTHIYGI